MELTGADNQRPEQICFLVCTPRYRTWVNYSGVGGICKPFSELRRAEPAARRTAPPAPEPAMKCEGLSHQKAPKGGRVLNDKSEQRGWSS